MNVMGHVMGKIGREVTVIPMVRGSNLVIDNLEMIFAFQCIEENGNSQNQTGILK